MKNEKIRNDKMFVTVMSIFIASFIFLTFGFSYAFLTRSSGVNNIVSIQTGSITSNVTYDITNTTNVKLSQMNDTEGLAQTNYAQINITKNSNYNEVYFLNMEYYTSPGSFAHLIPLENIKVALFEINNGIVGANPIVGPTRINDLPIYYFDSNNIFDTTYNVSFGILNNSNTKSYALKIWLDENTPTSFDEYYLTLGARVIQETIVSHSTYNLSGVLRVDGTPVTGANVKIQNNLVTSSTTNGSFTLNNIPSGTYNLMIDYNNLSYETNVHIQSGSSANISSTNTTGTAGSYLQASAYNYYTTPYKIMKHNSNLTTTSNEATNDSYVTPTAFIITGIESANIENISGINIDINSSTGAISISK